MKILIVEDSKYFMTIQKEILEDQGHTVLCAYNGVQALEMAKDSRPDIIISDVLMPGMDGFELCRTIKSNEELKAIPFVFYSATFTESDDQKLAMDLGASKFIIKPTKPDIFIKEIEEVIEKHKKKKLSIPDHPTADGLTLGHMHNERLMEKLSKNMKKLEEEHDKLQKSEERLRSIFEHSAVGIVDTDNNYRVIHVNGALCKMLGYSRDELLEKTLMNIMHSDDYENNKDHIDQIAEGKYSNFQLENRYIHKNGDLIWGLANVFLVQDSQGNICCVTTQIQDITERKRAEIELKRRTHDLGERVKELNCLYGIAELVEKEGSSLDEILQGTVNLIPSSWQFPEVTCACIVLEGVRLYETDSYKKSRWIQSAHIKVRGKNIGSVEVYYLEKRPKAEEGPFLKEERSLINAIAERLGRIVERKQAEKALRITEERYVLAVEAVNDGLWDRDFETGNIYFSPRWTEMLGYEDNELPNRREEWIERVHPDDYARVMGEMNNYFNGNAPCYLSEHRLRHKDGSYRWVMAKGAMVRDKEGNPTRFVGSHTDITDRKKAEEKRRSLEAQLRQAQKMETLGTLAGGIAHDFNNILTPIMTYSEMVLEDIPADSPNRDDIGHIIKAAERAKELVKQMLTFSRHNEQERLPVEIKLIVNEVITLLRPILPTTIEIRESIGTDCGTVLADPGQIHQVLMNICTNAAHAMQDEGGVLKVSVETVKVDTEFTARHLNLQPGEYVRLSIGDTGHGMDKETKERIFDPFFTTKGIGEGTGLGLSVVHGIVLNHEGEINVESTPGEGATFHVFLPLFDGDLKWNVDTSDRTTPKGKEHILFVDDEVEIVSMGGKILRRLGYEVTESCDGIEALKEFSTNPEKYDLIITDYTMPKMTGLHLTREVRNIRPDIPIIIISGYNEKITPENIQKLGISEYVVKPFTIHRLGTTIRRVLDGGK